MLPQWTACLICLWLPLVEMLGTMSQPDFTQGGAEKMKHDAIEMHNKAVVAKKNLDEKDITEQQFYECFADINCELGVAVKNQLFDCWHMNKKEELDIYVQLFKDSPVGNFTRMTLTGVNEDFCELDDYDQRKVNEHFAIKAGENIKEICGRPKLMQRCKRLQKTRDCVIELIEINIANGKCDTIVAEMEGMEPMKQMSGM